MDLQIRNNLKCQIARCNNIALGINPWTQEWICGLCLKKLEAKMRAIEKKRYEIFEKEMVEENNG